MFVYHEIIDLTYMVNEFIFNTVFFLKKYEGRPYAKDRTVFFESLGNHFSRRYYWGFCPALAEVGQPGKHGIA